MSIFRFIKRYVNSNKHPFQAVESSGLIIIVIVIIIIITIIIIIIIIIIIEIYITTQFKRFSFLDFSKLKYIKQ